MMLRLSLYPNLPSVLSVATCLNPGPLNPRCSIHVYTDRAEFHEHLRQEFHVHCENVRVELQHVREEAHQHHLAIEKQYKAHSGLVEGLAKHRIDWEEDLRRVHTHVEDELRRMHHRMGEWEARLQTEAKMINSSMQAPSFSIRSHD